ncbi:MAG: putative sugar nucleotidyl transferase [Phycisphaerales bacterium]
MQPAIVFDDGLGRLGPLTDLRASFDVRTGARTTLDRLRHELGLDVRGLATPPELVDITQERHSAECAAANGAHALQPVMSCGASSGGLPWFVPGLLLVNGRCVVPLPEIVRLDLGECLVDASSGHVLAARPAKREDGERMLSSFDSSDGWTRLTHDRPVLLQRPWHVRTFLEDALSTDLISMASHADEPELRGVMAFGDAPLAIHPTAKVCPGVVFDCENGPIVVDDHAVVRPARSSWGRRTSARTRRSSSGRW